MTSTEELPTTDEPAEAPAPSGPTETTVRRRAPGWARWAAAALSVLLALGVGYALGVQSITGDRDQVKAALSDAETARDDAEAELADAEAAVEAADVQVAGCADLAESATDLHDTSADFVADWSALFDLMESYADAPITTDVTDADLEVFDKVTHMTGQSGEITATAARVLADVKACQAS